MARPRKEGMDYYPHDTDAANDEKIEAMRTMFGNDGYAFYFILLERIYRSNNAQLDVSKKVFKMATIAKVMVDEVRFEEMMDAAIDLELFDEESYREKSIITSNGINRRYSEVKNMRNRWRKRKENPEDNEVFPRENPVDNPTDNAEVTGESKAKQSKEKKSISSSSGEPFKLFESEGFGTISSLVADDLNDFINTYGEIWTVEAMKIAVRRGKRSLGFVHGILKNFQSSGIDEPWKGETHEKFRRQPQIVRPGRDQAQDSTIRIPTSGKYDLSDEEFSRVFGVQ